MWIARDKRFGPEWATELFGEAPSHAAVGRPGGGLGRDAGQLSVIVTPCWPM
jgi:hypothetical protein